VAPTAPATEMFQVEYVPEPLVASTLTVKFVDEKAVIKPSI
jgi:hypothetical protein